MASETFATAINCIDGRVQIPVIEYMKRRFAVDFVDIITEPGPNKILAENADKISIDSIKRRVKISVECHDSKLIAVVGHSGCAGNPSDKKIQIAQISSAIKTIESWNFNVQVIGLWVDKNWRVYHI